MNQRGLQAAGAEGRLSPPYSSLIPFSDLDLRPPVKLSPFPHPQPSVKSGIRYSVQEVGLMGAFYPGSLGPTLRRGE